jgi:hypothetical protein
MARSGAILIILGVLVISAAVVIDLIRTGALQIRAAQILVVELGTLLIALGLLLKQISAKGRLGEKHAAGSTKWPGDIPMSTWVVAGFLVTYISFFIAPMFFGLPPRMQYFNKYLPDRFPIGHDLLLTVDLIRQWFEANQSPFHVEFYPPFTYIFLSPLALIEDTHTLFKVVTLMTIISFIISSLFIALLINGHKNKALIFTFFAMGLFSYGMQFELERGQINVLAFLFSMSAIYIYHRYHDFRRYAYLLFSIAIQLKIYPAIFVVMFVRDWRDWKGNLRRFLALGLFNFALLFITGVQPFKDFLDAITTQLAKPGWAWTGNHSIRAFVSEFAENGGFGLVSTGVLETIRQNAETISNAFLAAFILCFLLTLLRAYQRNQPAFDPSLFLICVLGALIVPISNDYTLSILPAPMALALSALATNRYGKSKPMAIILLFAAATAYSATLYPFKYKPLFLQNLFPALFIVLITVTLLNWMIQIPREDTATAEA